MSALHPQTEVCLLRFCRRSPKKKGSRQPLSHATDAISATPKQMLVAIETSVAKNITDMCTWVQVDALNGCNVSINDSGARRRLSYMES
jgi:hypothetical protein